MILIFFKGLKSKTFKNCQFLMSKGDGMINIHTVSTCKSKSIVKLQSFTKLIRHTSGKYKKPIIIYFIHNIHQKWITKDLTFLFHLKKDSGR